MKKQWLIIGIITGLTTTALSGCTEMNNNRENKTNDVIDTKFVGKWDNIDNESGQEGFFYKNLIFFSDGHGEFIDWVNYTSLILYQFNETHLTFSIIVDSEESGSVSYIYTFTDTEAFALTVGNKIIHYKKISF